MASPLELAAVAERVAGRLRQEYGVLRLRRCDDRLESGFIVAVEGPDGAGVSTHASIVAEVLARLVEGGPARVLLTKEPTGGPIGFLVWEILKGYLPESFRRPDVLAYLVAADRLYHLYADSASLGGAARGVMDAVANGYIVVMDRYKYSSAVYQSASLPGSPGLPMDEILYVVNRYAPPAHVLLYVDAPPEVSLSRIVRERSEVHLYEAKARLAQIRSNYHRLLKLLAEEPEYPQLSLEGRPLQPPWWSRVPRAQCIYGEGTWPAIVESASTKPLEESAEETARRLIETLLQRELLL